MDIELPNYSNDTFNFLGEIKYKSKIFQYMEDMEIYKPLLNISNNEWNINLGTGSKLLSKQTKNLKL